MTTPDTQENYVAPSVLEHMTPEGQHLLRRVIESTGLVIHVLDTHPIPEKLGKE